MLLGRCISRIGCPLRTTSMGFFTIFDGDFEKYIQDFADKTSVRFRYSLSTCRWRAANPSSKERPGVLSVGIGKQPSAHRVLQRLSRPLGSRHSKPCWPTASHNRPPLDSRCGTTINQELRVGKAEHNTRRNTL